MIAGSLPYLPIERRPVSVSTLNPINHLHDLKRNTRKETLKSTQPPLLIIVTTAPRRFTALRALVIFAFGRHNRCMFLSTSITFGAKYNIYCQAK
ncbi:hypothetical protein VTL71DRAFT_5201 [Oculimacula yallundae]|uniref:Uncharacterized protein n=1 Tax=Oculimacula yallundae TaxID=86028 RepID=A0ABR4C1K8_9HELO